MVNKFLLAVLLAMVVGCATEPSVTVGVMGDVRTMTEYRHAMQFYREAHPICEWCGQSRDMAVDHAVPVHVDPSRAADTNNMVSLCGRCHFVLGHACNYKKWVENVKAIIAEGIIRGGVELNRRQNRK